MNQPDAAFQEPLPPAPGARGNLYQAAAICALLLLAVGLVFGQTVHYGFINLDDSANVYANPDVTRGLSAESVRWAFTQRYLGCWMPLVWISHMLDCQLYGLEAGGHHLTNVLLHAATTVLLFLVLRAMTGRMWPSALVAAVFAVHPLRVESVAWVAERKDVLSGLFFVLTLAAYAGYAHHRFSLVRYAAVMAPFAMGLMAKPMLVTLPLVLLLLDYWPLERWGSRATEARRWRLGVLGRLVLEKLPLLAMTAFSCFETIRAHRGDLAHALNLGFPLPWRIENAALSYVGYLGMFFYPANLATPYPLPTGLDLPLWKVLGAALILVAVTWAALAERARRPYLLVGWLWYLGMLVPVSGILQFGWQTMADRFTYLPQIGVCLALAWGLADALAPWPRLRPVWGAAGASIVAMLAVCAWHQTSFWRDSVTLWNHTLACTTRNTQAHDGLGEALQDLGQVDKAIDQYRAAITIDPDDALSHYNLGVALASVGRFDEAVEQYRKTIQLQPNHAGAHNNLGTALYLQRRLDEAMTHFQEAIRIDPLFAEAHFNAGNIWHYRGDLDKAMAEYQAALKANPVFARGSNVKRIAGLLYQEDLKANPVFASARYALGLILARRRRWDEAIAEYRTVLEASPPFAAEVHNSLGRALAACGRTEEAAAQYRSALALRPDFAKARRNLDKLLAGRAGHP